MKINKVYCLFEQSGTFKKALRKQGIEAEDYDILNDFGETDHITDIFAEIDKAYEGKPSIFDSVGDLDLVLAFFPCTRFECRIPLEFRGEAFQQKDWSDQQKLEYSMQLHEELHKLYILLCKLFQISLRGGWRLIVENPYTAPHYLTMYFPIKPKVIVKDRHEEGDYYKKPTQFFFVNCDPEQNVVLEPMQKVEKYIVSRASRMKGDVSTQVKRSLMHPQFADRFIKTYILDKQDHLWI
jgi:hypothetical protein